MTQPRRPAVRRLSPILLLLPCCALLVACAGDPQVVTRIEYVRQTLPAELLTCYDAPAAPADGATLRDVTTYVLALDVAGQDCRDKLAAVREVVSESTR